MAGMPFHILLFIAFRIKDPRRLPRRRFRLPL
ncbi:hypothetical protein LINGRAHAP2_LOCUS5161 [Linum grandiflorum]